MCKETIPIFEGWPRRFAHRTMFGNYKVWCIQNKHDGHCIYNVKVRVGGHYVYAYGKSEQTMFGRGSYQSVTNIYDNALDFMCEWGLK